MASQQSSRPETILIIEDDAEIRSFLTDAVLRPAGYRVIIAREPCVLFARQTLQKKRPQTAYVTQTTPEVWRVLEELACPAFNARGDEVVIDENQCAGCMLCVQLCDDIKARKKE